MKVKKAVILAGGEGKRMRPLTYTRPKSLLYAGTKTILERDIEILKKLGLEIYVVVKYKKEMIYEKIKEKWKGVQIIEQNEEYGTGAAIMSLKGKIDGNFLVMAGDDIYGEEDIKKMLDHKNAIAVAKSKNPERFGVVEVENGIVRNIEEKPRNPKSDLVNTSMYVLNEEIFKKEIGKSERGEIEFVDLVKDMNVVVIKDWIPISYPWDLFKAHEYLIKNTEEYQKGEIINSTIKDAKVIVEEGAYVINAFFDGGMHYIGKNAKIGPNTYLRGNNFIGEKCEIGFGSTVKNSIIFPKTKAKHLSYIGDSVIGENVNFGSGTQIANFRFDGKNINVFTEKGWINTGSRKIGAFVGDNTKFGILSGVMPGKLIGNDCWIGGGMIIYRNVGPYKKIYKKSY